MSPDPVVFPSSPAAPGTATALVVGGGVAGLAAALALSRADVRVTLVDARPPEVAAPNDRRTTAVLDPGIGLLVRLGIWPALVPHSAPLVRLRLVSQSGRGPVSVTFEASEIGKEAFGWNVPNDRLRLALRTAALRRGVAIEAGVAVEQLRLEPAAGVIVLADGRALAADLVVAADGHRSTLRALAAIDTVEHAYDQAAIVTSFTHSRPHYDTSTELHRPGGPFTLVPMRGRRSSLVWGEHRADADMLMALPPAAFAEALQERVAPWLGQVTEIAPPYRFDVTSARARRFTAGRLLLLGEAAHALSPVGAQGFNLSLRDVEALARLVKSAAPLGELGGDTMMAAYERQRADDVLLRFTAIDGLTRLIDTELAPLQRLRSAGLRLIGAVPLLRRAVMRQLMQPAHLPRLGVSKRHLRT